MDVKDDVKKLLGVKPYDQFTNICYGDAIYYNSLVEKYGEEKVKATIKEEQ